MINHRFCIKFILYNSLRRSIFVTKNGSWSVDFGQAITAAAEMAGVDRCQSGRGGFLNVLVPKWHCFLFSVCLTEPSIAVIGGRQAVILEVSKIGGCGRGSPIRNNQTAQSIR